MTYTKIFRQKTLEHYGKLNVHGIDLRAYDSPSWCIHYEMCCLLADNHYLPLDLGKRFVVLDSLSRTDQVLMLNCFYGGVPKPVPDLLELGYNSDGVIKFNDLNLNYYFEDQDTDEMETDEISFESNITYELLKSEGRQPRIFDLKVKRLGNADQFTHENLGLPENFIPIIYCFEKDEWSSNTFQFFDREQVLKASTHFTFIWLELPIEIKEHLYNERKRTVSLLTDKVRKRLKLSITKLKPNIVKMHLKDITEIKTFRKLEYISNDTENCYNGFLPFLGDSFFSQKQKGWLEYIVRFLRGTIVNLRNKKMKYEEISGTSVQNWLRKYDFKNEVVNFEGFEEEKSYLGYGYKRNIVKGGDYHHNHEGPEKKTSFTLIEKILKINAEEQIDSWWIENDTIIHKELDKTVDTENKIFRDIVGNPKALELSFKFNNVFSLLANTLGVKKSNMRIFPIHARYNGGYKIYGFFIRGQDHCRHDTDRIPLMIIEFIKEEQIPLVSDKLAIGKHDELGFFTVAQWSSTPLQIHVLCGVKRIIIPICNFVSKFLLEDVKDIDKLRSMKVGENTTLGEFCRTIISLKFLETIYSNSQYEGVTADLRRLYFMQYNLHLGREIGCYNVGKDAESKVEDSLINCPLAFLLAEDYNTLLDQQLMVID